MKLIATAQQMKDADKYTIENIGVPSLVLMEKAALAVALKAAAVYLNSDRHTKIIAVCGMGNNGADGVATARMLKWQGLDACIYLIGNPDKQTDEMKTQLNIAGNSGVSVINEFNPDEYDIIIDAIFGVGLTRPVKDEYAVIIDSINKSDSVVVSVDIPSGIDATTGRILGTAVKADYTVTFGYNKVGLVLFPGRSNAGEITVADIGFAPNALNDKEASFTYLPEDLAAIPRRKARTNKGSFGKTLVIAGSEDMSGAACLSGLAAYRTGAGLVNIFSHINNTEIIKKNVPEAIVSGYDKENFHDKLGELLDNSSYLILGPGLSKDKTAEGIVKQVLSDYTKPVVADADALNIIASSDESIKIDGGNVIVTPHIGEMARLTGKDKSFILNNIVQSAQTYAMEHNCVCVLKDAVTVVASPSGKIYLNSSGNNSMAKAGSGDALTGIIAGLLSQGMELYDAACMGVYVHGLAGDRARDELGEYSVMATDIINCISKILS